MKQFICVAAIAFVLSQIILYSIVAFIVFDIAWITVVSVIGMEGRLVLLLFWGILSWILSFLILLLLLEMGVE